MRLSPQINPDKPSTGHLHLLRLPLPTRPSRCGAAHMPRESPHRTPRTVLLLPQSTLHQPHGEHTRCVIPHPGRFILCVVSSISDALFLLERPLSPLVRISDPLSPRLPLPTRTAAHVLQTRRTVQHPRRAPEDVRSRFGRHRTYQRHARAINRILPEALRAIPQAFHSLRGFVIPHR